MNKEIALLTCFMDNYGACLQAYALQSLLLEKGYAIDIIRYLEPRGYEDTRKIFQKIIRSNPVIKFRCLIDKKYEKEYHRHECFEKFRREHLLFFESDFYSYEEVKSITKKYDVFLCGSDQIWNPTFYKGPNRVYYLDFADGKRRVSYAPSIGINDMPKEYRDEFVRMISKFDCITVREETGKKIIEKYTKKKANVVLDPTFLLTSKKWEDFASTSKFNIGEEYIFCYLFGERDYYFKFIDMISQKLKCKVVIIPFTEKQHAKGYHNIWEANPVDFVKLVFNAKFVITDSFHATAFSINLNKPFYSLLRHDVADKESMNSRIFDILKLTKLENRLWYDNTVIDKFEDKIDWEVSNNILKEKREKHIEMLINGINLGRK